jgi:hypothetical protein
MASLTTRTLFLCCQPPSTIEGIEDPSAGPATRFYDLNTHRKCASWTNVSRTLERLGCASNNATKSSAAGASICYSARPPTASSAPQVVRPLLSGLISRLATCLRVSRSPDFREDRGRCLPRCDEKDTRMRQACSRSCVASRAFAPPDACAAVRISTKQTHAEIKSDPNGALLAPGRWAHRAADAA